MGAMIAADENTEEPIQSWRPKALREGSWLGQLLAESVDRSVDILDPGVDCVM